jgi:outer membrane protein OmpA-like peptidoglycan-associated protein
MTPSLRAALLPGGGIRGRLVTLIFLIATAQAAFPACAQETVYIGGRTTAPAVEVDLSAINGGAIPRHVRSNLPDLMPLDPANAPGARAATSVRLTKPETPTPVQTPVAPPPAKIAAPVVLSPATLSPGLVPATLSPGLVPAAPPGAPALHTNLTAAAAPKPIIPAKASVAHSEAPPMIANAPQMTAALPAPGLTPAAPATIGAPGVGVAAALLFGQGAVELTPEAVAQLDAVAASLTQNDRVQLKAHASGALDDADVRRVALKRALAARAHLLAGGIESTRIDVRALVPAADGGSDDRLDVIVAPQ